MNAPKENKQEISAKLKQLRFVRVQVKKALEEVEEKPKSEHAQETINRLSEQLEKIDHDIINIKKTLGESQGMDLEIMDIMTELEKRKKN